MENGQWTFSRHRCCIKSCINCLNLKSQSKEIKIFVQHEYFFLIIVVHNLLVAYLTLVGWSLIFISSNLVTLTIINIVKESYKIGPNQHAVCFIGVWGGGRKGVYLYVMCVKFRLLIFLLMRTANLREKVWVCEGKWECVRVCLCERESGRWRRIESQCFRQPRVVHQVLKPYRFWQSKKNGS